MDENIVLLKQDLRYARAELDNIWRELELIQEELARAEQEARDEAASGRSE